jgi:hypothetical protein
LIQPIQLTIGTIEITNAMASASVIPTKQAVRHPGREQGDSRVRAS